MTDIGDVLSKAAEEATGAVIKQREMMNLSFTILSAEPVTSTVERKGEDGVTREVENFSWKATFTFNDGDEPQMCWLSGVICYNQVGQLIEKGMLPARVKLIGEASGKGTAYKLVEGDPSGVATTQQSSGRAADNRAIAAAGIDAAFEAFKANGVDKYLTLNDDGDPILAEGIPLPEYAKIKSIIKSLAIPFE